MRVSTGPWMSVCEVLRQAEGARQRWSMDVCILGLLCGLAVRRLRVNLPMNGAVFRAALVMYMLVLCIKMCSSQLLLVVCFALGIENTSTIVWAQAVALVLHGRV